MSARKLIVLKTEASIGLCLEDMRIKSWIKEKTK
jgi:hypothetical protein